MGTDDLIAVEECAQIFGVSVRQVRYYKSLRVVRVAAVQHNRQLYSRSEVTKRKALFDQLRADGFSLEQIALQLNTNA